MAERTKRVDGEDLTAADFLIVGDKEDTSTWKLPWRFSTDEKTKSHLRNALARFDQLKDVSEEDKKKAYAKLKRLAEEYGIDVSDDSKSRSFRTKEKLRMEIKEIAADGSFEGILSPYGNVDLGGDLVEPGAYTKTMQERGDEIPLLWQHQTHNPVGKLTLVDSPEGLRVKGQLLMDLPEAKRAYLLVKARIVKGLSIGFDSIKDAIVNGVRHLKEIRLYEGSIVTFPMNDRAQITSIKQMAGEEGDGPNDFNEELEEIQLRAASYQLLQALDAALCEVRCAQLTKEEMASASETIIDQFREAYTAWLPSYLDLMEEMYGPMEMMSRGRMEKKEGRRLSTATKPTIQAAMDHHQAMGNLLSALLQEEAGDSDEKARATSAAKAATPRSEPGEPHSAAESLIDSMRSLIPTA